MHKTDQTIQERFAFGGRNNNLPWYPRRGTREQLVELFTPLGFKEVVEVGTRQGNFAKVICTKNPGVHLTCVDPYIAYNARTQAVMDGFFQEAVKNLSRLNATLVRKTSMDAVGEFKDGSLDAVYIDGNHLFEFAIMDIIKWSYKVRRGGLVAVHDYDHFCGCDVPTAVDAYTRCNHIDPWYITREYNPTAFWVKP